MLAEEWGAGIPPISSSSFVTEAVQGAEAGSQVLVVSVAVKGEVSPVDFKVVDSQVVGFREAVEEGREADFPASVELVAAETAAEIAAVTGTAATKLRFRNGSISI